VASSGFVEWDLRLLIAMSESAADTLRATGAEDKPLLGSKLSTDSGAKTRLGFGEN
jgi:hypothetical protein